MNIVKLHAMNLSESFTAHEYGLKTIANPTRCY